MTEYNLTGIKRRTVTVEQMKETEKYFKKIEKKKLSKVGWGLPKL